MKSNMKFVLILALFGVANSALFICDEAELQKCYSYDPRTKSKPYVDTDAELDLYCKSLGCVLECIGAGIPDGFDMRHLNKEMRILRDYVCMKESPLRKRFLDNAKCLNSVASLTSNCRDDNVTAPNLKEYCKEIRKGLDCAGDIVERECGKEQRDIFEDIYPSYEYYGCMKPE